MKKSLRSMLVDTVAYSPFLTKLAFKVLYNRYILNSPPVQFLLHRQISFVKRKNAEFPRLVAAENTNICNARCIMCPYTRMKRSKGFMEMDLCRKIIDECARYEGVELTLSGFGEPFLDKNLFERITYAKARGIEKVKIFTNASLLDEDKARRIIDSGLDEIILSIDGYDKESYERVRVGLNFETVYGNIKRLYEMRGKRRTPGMIASIILFKEYVKHRKKIIGLWGRYTDHVFTKPPDDWAGEISELKDTGVGPETHLPCPYIWRQLLISWDGTAALCCRDLCNLRYPLGKVVTHSLHEVWHGEKLREVRQADAKARSIPPCRECAYTPNWWDEK